jgi:SSS family solute:Na+ symporter
MTTPFAPPPLSPDRRWRSPGRHGLGSRCVSLAARGAILATLLTVTAFGAEAGGATLGRRAGLHWVDWVIIVVYLGAVLGLGNYYSKRQSNNAEYFTAAKTHIHPFLVGISLFASLLSTISYLGKPGEMINKGPVVLVGQVISIPFAYYIVAYWIIPKIMQQRVTSAYELLETRLGVTGRLLGAILFVKLRLVWMGLLVYVSSTALVVILNLNFRWIPAISVVVGIVPLIYTSMGGLRAVVVANVVQFFLLLLGAIVTIVIVTVRCGGFSWWPTAWSPYWDTQPFFSLDPHVRVTVFGATISMLIWRVCTAGGDQMAIQHYMATRDVTATRRSYFTMACAAMVVTIVLAVLGIALLGFFSRFPELLGPGMELEKSADHLFPYFVSNLLPVGVSGLVVAAIMAASSGMDTGVNAVTAVVMKDFFERFGWKPATEARRLTVTKYVSFGIGFAVVCASMLVQLVPGNILEMTSKLANLEATTIFGLFFLALFVPCATPLGALFGAVYGLTASVLVAFWDVMTGRPAISFLYIGVVGLVFDLGVGYLVSRFGPSRDNRRATWWTGVVLFVVLIVAVVLLLAKF